MWYKRRNRHRYDPYADTPIPVLHTAEVTANRHWFGPKAKSDRRKWVQIREGASLASAVSPQPSPELQPTKPVLYRGDRI
jgi:hypothetical protein